MSVGDRDSSQFPSKFSSLPGITNLGGSPAPGNQLFPYADGGDRFPRITTSTHAEENEDRIRQLEARLGVAERTNQSLLDEMVRTQQELRSQLRRTKDAIRSERSARQQAETALRMNADAVAQLGGRLQKAEDRTVGDRSSIATLAGQLKGVEQALMLGQQENTARRDLQAST